MRIGAYAIEQDYSHYVAYASKTVFAVVGTATKGPVGEATVCTSTQDLVNRFGPLFTKSTALYAGQYFLSQSSKLYFVRAASASAKEASTIIPGKDIDGANVLDALSIQVKEKGTYANGYVISIGEGIPRVVDDVSTPTVNITLRTKLGVSIENIKNVLVEDIIEGYEADNFIITAGNASAVSIAVGNYVLSGGNDGIDDIDAGDYILAAQKLLADTVDMNLFAIPGVSDAEVVTAMLALAETRGDCLYLVDPPKGLTRDGVVNWHNGGGDYEHAAFNSSYGALYYDWVTIYDPVNKVKINVPPSVVVAATIAYSDRVSEVWYAPAGLQRGIVRGVLDSVTKLNKSDIEYMYSSDNRNNINCIYDDPQVGLVVWGQKTLLRADSALDRVNVRRLMNYVKRITVAACNYLTFEPNDRVTWNSFKMKIEPVLQSIVKKRGMYEYKLIKGETIVTPEDIDNYRMPCMVLIRPTKAAEEIPIYFTLTSTGADFNEVLEANGIVQ